MSSTWTAFLPIKLAVNVVEALALMSRSQPNARPKDVTTMKTGWTVMETGATFTSLTRHIVPPHVSCFL
jgi:hypothetical protein